MGSILLLFSALAHARCEDYVSPGKPQNADRTIVGQDLDTIVERGFITLAVYEDFPPYSWYEDGKSQGVDIEIGKIIAQDLGVEPRFDFVAADETLQSDMRNYLWKGSVVGGRVSNVMLRVPYDSALACRIEQVVFTGQYAQETIAIAYSKEAYPDSAPVPAYFRFDLVGVENDSIADFYLSALFSGQLLPNIRRYPHVGDAMKALDEGALAAVVAPRTQLEFGATSRVEIHQPPLPGFALGTWTLGVGVNFRYRPLAYAVDDAIAAALADGRIEAAYAKYGLSFTPAQR